MTALPAGKVDSSSTALLSMNFSPANKLHVKRNFRLRERNDFFRVRQSGKSYAHPLIVLLVSPNDLDRSRIAVSASRYTGNAVRRNLIKRRLREIIRPIVKEISPGYDLIVLARRNTAGAVYQDLQHAVVQMLQQASLLK